MTTYTIATTIPASDGASLLLATVPDGGNIAAAALAEIQSSRLDAEHPIEWRAISGLTLTDDEPDDESTIVWRGHDCGWLEDETGRTYQYAVRASRYQVAPITSETCDAVDTATT